MGKVKGQVHHEKFLKGEKLTRAKSILAKCYECNGYGESGIDCEIEGCPLYPYHYYRQRKG